MAARARALAEEARDLYIGHSVDEVDASDGHEPPIDPLTFYREYVAMSRPCVFRGAAKDWPAASKWSDDYLEETLGQNPITVALTPNGRADAITADDRGLPHFCLPDYQTMTFKTFLERLNGLNATSTGSTRGDVPYIQLQNNSLKTEFSVLLGDVPPNGPEWALEAFGGCEPEAVNVWMGEERSHTSFHKDHYENLYAVISGSKTFLLFPPHEGFRIQKQTYPAASFKLSEGAGYDIVPDGTTISWSPLDLEKDPRSFEGAIRCRVNAGDVFYLPALWFHYVTQERDADGSPNKSVNYWFDMRFGPSYLAGQLADALSEEL